jgi:hypothetical protein
MNNNIVSVKLGNKVFSWDINNYNWTDVTATYPYIGGTLQTKFAYEDDGRPTPPDETGGYFICDNKIWSLEKWDGMDGIYASPLYTSWDGSKYVLPLYFNTYEMPILCSDPEFHNQLTEFPHEGDTFYFLDGDVKTVANATLYSTMTAGSTATNAAAPYDKPLIYNRNLDCIEKSLGNIEVVGDFKAASITTPSLTAEAATIDDLTVTNPVEDLTVENLTVTDTASINHAVIVTEEDIHSEDDYIELRVNNPLPTPSTGSGFRVKNYDGNNHDLELTTDSSGTFRIGGGNLSMQPLLTRDEAAQMVNGAPLVWNAAANKAQTTSTTDGNKVLKSVKNSQTGVVSYEWSSSGSGAVWRGTQAQLTAALLITDPNDEAYIPNNAMIIITDADETYLIGEEQ